MPSRNQQDTISLRGWQNAVIHANGVTLIFEEVEHRPVFMENGDNVTWQGGILRFVHPAFTQGRITAISSDAAGDYCDLQIDAGYSPEFNLNTTPFDIVDHATRLLKVNTSDWAPASHEQTGPGLFRLHYPHDRAPRFEVGDWLVARSPGGRSIFHLHRCHACTLENVALQNAGFAAFFETEGAGANKYLGCKVEPGPRPPGATEDPLVGCGADGFHSNRTETGPTIENCVFSGVFLDDCIAIHGTFSRVTRAEGNDVFLFDEYPLPQPGDTIRIADMNGFFAAAKCTGVEQQADKVVRVTLDRDLHVPIDHTQDSDKRKGTKASNPRYCGRGYVIRNCRLGNTRSRGILVKADDGLIEGCTIEGCGMTAVSIGPEFWWNEAGYCWNVQVVHNKFIACDKNNDKQATVWIHGDGAMGNRGIAIRGNSFENCYGQSIIRLDWTDGATITGNTIAGSFGIKSWSAGNVIALFQTRNVQLLDNIVKNQGAFAGDLVGLDASVPPSEVAHNDPAGIRVDQP